MKFYIFVALVVSFALLEACSSVKGVGFDSVKKEAGTLFDQGKYYEALSLYKTIDSLRLDSVSIYRASMAAMKCGEFCDGLKYSKRINAVNDSAYMNEIHSMLSTANKLGRCIDCVESESSFLEKLCGKAYLQNRLATYYVTTNNPKIVDLYPNIDDSKLRSECFHTYFQHIKSIYDESELVKICKSALIDDKEQIVALKYLGVNQYNKSEADYKKAMDEYNKNKNQTAYAYLRRDLKAISKDYVKSRDYLDKVHALDPSDMQVVKILININNRLDQPAKAKALQKLLK